jgi:hypothetical protein
LVRSSIQRVLKPDVAAVGAVFASVMRVRVP